MQSDIIWPFYYNVDGIWKPWRCASRSYTDDNLKYIRIQFLEDWIFTFHSSNVITYEDWKALLQNWYLFGRKALPKLQFLCSNAGHPIHLKNPTFARFEGYLFNKFILQWVFFLKKLLLSVLIWANLLNLLDIELFRVIIVALKSSH